MLVLVEGQVKAFGKRDEVLVALGGKPLAPSPAYAPSAAMAKAMPA
jgi:ABC-type protease/lipase transport system fused ATPase/permease subunit